MNEQSENDSCMPIFVSRIGEPLNFRIVSDKISKARYSRLIVKFGGAVTKNSGHLRLNVVQGSMPCEEGHQNCSDHPPFEAEPLFKALWIEHCISQKELLNISAYLMNPKPEFAKIDFMQRLGDGTYKATASFSSPKKKPCSTLTYRILPVDWNLKATPEWTAQMKIIESFGKLADTLPKSPQVSSRTANSPRANKVCRNAPLVSSTPLAVPAVGLPAEQTGKHQNDRNSIPGDSDESPQRKRAENSTLTRTQDKRFTSKNRQPEVPQGSESDSCFGSLEIPKLDLRQPSKPTSLRVTDESNAIAKTQRALTDPIPGTSRDTLQPNQEQGKSLPKANQPVSDDSSSSSSSPEFHRRPLARKVVSKKNTNQPDNRSESDSSSSDSQPAVVASRTESAALQKSKLSKNAASKADRNTDRNSQRVIQKITYESSDSDVSRDRPPSQQPEKTVRQVVLSSKPAKRVIQSDSDEEFGPPPGAVVRLKGVRQNTRTPYSQAEEMAIINYILASKKLTGLRSNVVWKQMDGKPGVERRTWQSLREHFVKKMLPRLERFDLTAKQIKEMRSTS